MGPSSASPTGSSLVFAARLGELGQMVHLVRTCCERFAIPLDVVVRVELVLEELFTNTVQHGYRHADGGKVWVRIEPKAGGIRVIYEDAAPPYNPFADDSLGAMPDDGHSETYPLGGLGLLLVPRLSRARGYAYDNSRQRNVITLEFGS